MRAFVVLALSAGFLGCSSEVTLKPTPVSVSGKVSQGSQPVGNIVMVFQPLGDGHVREFAIQKDGTFRGELVSGEYAYYVAKPTSPTSQQSSRKLSPEYFEADLSRTVAVGPEGSLAIALD